MKFPRFLKSKRLSAAFVAYVNNMLGYKAIRSNRVGDFIKSKKVAKAFSVAVSRAMGRVESSKPAPDFLSDIKVANDMYTYIRGVLGDGTAPIVLPTSLDVNPSPLAISVGNTIRLVPTVGPSNATDRTVNFVSRNPALATVAANGDVVGIAPGAAIIDITTNSGNITKSVTANVSAVVVVPTGLSVSPNPVSLVVGQSITLVPTVTPPESTDKTVKYVSRTPAMATVDSAGKVVAIAAGSPIIDITTNSGGILASVTVNVSAAAVSPIRALGQWNPMNDGVSVAPAGLTSFYVPVKMITGSGDANGVIINFPAWYTPNTNTGMGTDLGNDINIVEASIQSSTVSAPVKFSGNRTGVVPNGANLISDVISPADLGFTGGSIPVGTVLWFKMKATVPSGGKIPSSPRNLYGQGNVSGWFYDAAATVVPSVDALANSTTGYTGTKPVDAGNLYAPLLLGTFVNVSTRAYAGEGDSIESGYNDLSPGFLGGGFFQRAMREFAVPMASINFGISGAKSNSLLTDPRILAYYKYVPDGQHIMTATNDFGVSSPPTAASIIANIDARISRYKGAPGVKSGAKSVVSRLLPRTTSTDQFVTETNQSINVNWNPGEVVEQFNNLITTAKYDGVISNDIVRGTNVSKWAVNGTAQWQTADGTHPNNGAGGSMLLAGAYAPVLQATWGEAVVNVPVQGVSVTGTVTAGTVGGTGQATAAFNPTNATNKGGVWASSNTSAVTINATSGAYSFVGAGNANITFTSTNGAKVGTLALTSQAANVAVTAVTVNLANASIVAGASAQATATFTPTGSTDKTGAWSSSNTAIGTVDTSGAYKGVAAGTFDVIFTSANGKVGKATVTVAAAAASTVSANFYDAGGDWTNGIWGGDQDKAIALIENNSTNLAAFVGGVTVTFSDGRTLVIESTETATSYIKLGFNATKLPKSLGSPNVLKAPAPAAGSTDPVYVTYTTAGTPGNIVLAGVNMSGLGSNPHVDNSIASIGTHYRDVEQKYITKYSGLGCKVIRMPIAPERCVDVGGGALRETYMTQIKSALDRLATAGMKAIIDPHSYMRLYTTVSASYDNTKYSYGEAQYPAANTANPGPRKLWIPIGAPDCLMTKAQYADLLTKLATRFGGHAGCLGIGIANEPFSRTQDPFNVTTQYIADAQYYKDAITAGSTTCNIYVCGGEYGTAYNWPTVSDALKNITDQYGQVVYEAHQYLDGNLSGGGYWGNRNEVILVDNFVKMVTPFVNWLKTNGKRGTLGEEGFPAGNRSAALATAKGLDYCGANGLPVMQWCAGPGWSLDDVNGLDDDNMTYKNNLDPIKSVFGKTTNAYGSPGA